MTARLNGQELPEGWEATRGEALFSWSSGKNLTAKEQIAGNLPIYGGNGINGYHKEALVEHSTLVVGRVGANCGNVYVTNGPAWITDNAIYAKNVPQGLNLKFIKIAFDIAKLNDQSAGSGQPFVNQRMLNEVSIHLPPTQEQHRIVAAIETQFTRLDAAVTALKRSQANLKRYRAAVLKAACEGRLVPTEAALAQAEGRSYEPASVLLERILDERRRKWEAENPKKKYQEPVAPDTSGLPELPEGWCWATVDGLTSHITSGSRGWADYYSQDGAIFIRAQDINTDELVLDNVAHVDLPNSVEGIRTQIRRNDLLVTITGANVTKTALVKIEIDNAYVNQHVGLVRPVEANCSVYLYLWIISPIHGRKQLEKYAYGAGKPGLNLTNIREVVVALPPLAEQRRIVAEVERRLSLIDQLEKTIQTDLARANRLRQSILKRAFAGQLVLQDPNDEPASVLLERIQAAKNGEPVQVKLPL